MIVFNDAFRCSWLAALPLDVKNSPTCPFSSRTWRTFISKEQILRQIYPGRPSIGDITGKASVESPLGPSSDMCRGRGRTGRLYLAPHLPPAKPSATHAMMNSNNPKVQQNTPRVQINARYVPDSGCVQNQTLQAHVPAESINPKRLMEPAAYRNRLRLFCVIKLEGIDRPKRWLQLRYRAETRPHVPSREIGGPLTSNRFDALMSYGLGPARQSVLVFQT